MAKSPLQLGAGSHCPLGRLKSNSKDPITRDDLEDLINTFLTIPYKPEDPRSHEYLERCWSCFRKDYKIGLVPNPGGTLCAHYPSVILIPEEEISRREQENGAVQDVDVEIVISPSLDKNQDTEPEPVITESDTDTEPTSELSEWVQVSHEDGELTRSFNSNYEEQFIPEKMKAQVPVTSQNGARDGAKPPQKEINNANSLSQLFLTARFARARSRFAVPVLLYKNNNLCRGSTLSVGAELFGRTGWDRIATGGEGVEEGGASNIPERSMLGREEQLCDKVRGQDIKLLKALRVRLICDLMYEQKKHKFMLPVASSEKVDKQGRYREFQVASMPYPGCESFRGYQSKDLDADKIKFNWKSGKVDATLNLPVDIMPQDLEVKWVQYQHWSIRELTTNYLRYVLYQMEHVGGGVFVHCISGWDRTPMFISLLRLSLWADGLVHASLNTLEMLFFTIAYDWRLFGHKLSERNAKSEEIFFFGMDFLKYLAGSEFSIHSGLKKGGSKPTEILDARMGKLGEMRELFLESYHKIIVPKSIKFSKLI